MKIKRKYRYILLLFLAILGALEHDIRNYLTPSEISMSEETVKYKVRYRYILDGDTAVFNLDGQDVTVRFLAVDTPELEEEGYQEAKDFTDRTLRMAERITLEMDPYSQDYDKFDRMLAWVWVDNELLQAKMIEKGYAQIRYLFGDYLYTDYLYKLQSEK